MQNIIAKGGSLTISLEGKSTELNKVIKNQEGKNITEMEDFKEIEKTLIQVTADNTSSVKLLTEAIKLKALETMSDIESRKTQGSTSQNNTSPVSQNQLGN